MALLEIDNLMVSYGPVRALHGVSLRVEAGSIVTLIGANGAGKSTVLKAVSGIVKAESGEARFEGGDLLHSAPHETVRRGVVQCPEGRGVFPNLTVEENLLLGAYSRSDVPAIRSDKERQYGLFPRLRDRRRQSAGTLSGGEQQMLAMGRALMAKPKLLLLDEPSLGLAPQVVVSIFETIVRINREGVTVLLVEQNAHLALETAHRAYVMETGRMTLEGPSQTVRNDPRVKAAYLGE